MKIIAAVLAALMLTLLSIQTAGAVELAAHRAFYRLSLANASTDSNMAGVEGAISFELKDACDAWIVEQDYALRFQLANGGDVDNVDKFVSWESKDGKEYRFNVTRTTNGKETERIGGHAELESRGGPGRAVFDEPSKDRIALAKGTVFPSEHTALLIEKAEKGQRFDRHLLFDGSKVEPSAPVTTIILGKKQPGPTKIIKPPLGPSPVWPMQLAFFAADGKAKTGEELPDFEMTMDVQPNGIVTGLTLNFGDFTVKGELEKLVKLPSSGC